MPQYRIIYAFTGMLFDTERNVQFENCFMNFLCCTIKTSISP